MNIDELKKKIQKQLEENDELLSDSDGQERLIETLATYEGEDRLVWTEELIERMKEKPKITPMPTNVENLDEALNGGFRPQQLITLTAHTKHGKTAFGLFLLKQMEEMNSVMIPLEQSNEELVDQLSENGHYIPRFLSPLQLAGEVNLDWIEERIIEGIAKHNTRFVLIDHLGYIDEFSNQKFMRENQAFRITKIMQGLKMIAKRWNITICLIVHIAEADETKPPMLSDIKGSSSIKQESDGVIMLWRKNKTAKGIKIYENKAMLSVQANRRNGNNTVVGLEFDSATGAYNPSDWVDRKIELALEESEAEDEFELL